jgi:hypothetical protein
MAGGKSDEIELEDGFEESGDSDSNADVAKTNGNSVKNALVKRRA